MTFNTYKIQKQGYTSVARAVARGDIFPLMFPTISIFLITYGLLFKQMILFLPANILT